MTTQRFITAPYTAYQEPSSLAVAIAVAFEHAQKHGQHVLIVFPTYGVAENAGGVLSKLFGQRPYEQLLKKRTLGTAPVIRIVSVQDARSIYDWPGPVVLAFAKDKMFEAAAQFRNTTMEIAVPNIAGDTAAWEASHRPQPLGNAVAAPAPPKLEPVVSAALKSLNSLVNTNKGMDGREKEDTLRTFSILLQHGHRPNTMAVVAALTGKHGWPPKMAGEAGELLDGLKAGKKYRGMSGPWPDAYRRWHEAATKGDGTTS